MAKYGVTINFSIETDFDVNTVEGFIPETLLNLAEEHSIESTIEYLGEED
jgi:hypothetical protein